MVAMIKLPSTMRLPIPAHDDNGSERRVFLRKSSDACVQGVRVDHTIAAHRQPQLSLTLRDISAGGLSATTVMPLQQGESLSIYFAGDITRASWNALGRVVRCEPSAVGYRVALQFDQLAAA